MQLVTLVTTIFYFHRMSNSSFSAEVTLERGTGEGFFTKTTFASGNDAIVSCQAITLKNKRRWNFYPFRIFTGLRGGGRQIQMAAVKERKEMPVEC